MVSAKGGAEYEQQFLHFLSQLFSRRGVYSAIGATLLAYTHYAPYDGLSSKDLGAYYVPLILPTVVNPAFGFVYG